MSDHKVALVTGAGSGIGCAVATRLELSGYKVVRSDLAGSDINADLATEAGRSHLAGAARRLASDGLDLVVAAAGIAIGPPGKIMAVNYHGAKACLEALRPLLAAKRHANAIAICSTAAIQDVDERLLDLALSNDEAATLAHAEQEALDNEYATSKRALSLWLRRTAVRPEWAGAGICLNGVAPGLTLTAMTRPLLADPEIAPTVKASTPRAVDKIGEAEDLAEVVCAIGSLKGGFMLGQVVFVDGGTDAIWRPDLV